MPMPVSSQDVSMPRTTGASVTQPPPHHDRVGAVVVVAAAGADLLEPEAPVDALSGRVVGAYLEEDLPRAPAARLVEQLAQHGAADAGAPVLLQHRDGLHVGLVGRGGE